MLEVHQCERVAVYLWNIGQIYLYHRARIRVRIVALGRRAAAHHDFAFIRRAWRTDTSRAPATREYATVINLLLQTVIGRRQVFAPHRAMVLGLVDDFLWVLDAHAKGKWFGLHQPPLTVEQFENIPCGMSCSQDHVVG